MTLSIAIYNHNGSRTIAQTLRSLNDQDAPVRWWLQDAQSSDESLELARALARPGDSISCETDQGRADGLNNAFQKMGGDILGFMNSDHLLLPGAARRILGEFDAHPEMDMLIGAVEYRDREGEPVRIHHGKIGSLGEILDLYHVWWKDRHFVQAEVFFRRSLWGQVGLFNNKYRFAFDYEYWVRCFQAGARLRNIDQTLAAVPKPPAQRSPVAIIIANEQRDILGEMFAPHRPLAVDPWFKWKLKQYLAYDRYQSGQDDPPQGRREPFLKQLVANPGWIIVPYVRHRLLASIRARLKKQTK